jgi:hypothetical protein
VQASGRERAAGLPGFPLWFLSAERGAVGQVTVEMGHRRGRRGGKIALADHLAAILHNAGRPACASALMSSTTR